MFNAVWMSRNRGSSYACSAVRIAAAMPSAASIEYLPVPCLLPFLFPLA